MAGPGAEYQKMPEDAPTAGATRGDEEDNYKHIRQTRDQLKKSGEMAIAHLVYAALEHASAAISHPDQTVRHGIQAATSKTRGEWQKEAESLVMGVLAWAKRNKIKVTLMVVGLGFSALKAKVMAQYMLDCAASYCSWSRRKGLPMRFVGFIGLMSIRLPVSTLVPPTSPGFGIIIQAATPDEQKWTAMPCFLLASAIAGAWPWIFDKILEQFTGTDFWFTMGAKRFADNYPLTCWTGPAMREAFHRVYESGVGEGQAVVSLDGEVVPSRSTKRNYGKLGASFAVIVGHVVPFMGAQTTIMQRFFLPHPLDTIVSQPFGMTEDLVSMAMAEAISNPVLASWSLTALIVFFNLARGIVFSGPHHEAHDKKVPGYNTNKRGSDAESPSAIEESGPPNLSSCSTAATPVETSAPVEEIPRDWVALASGIINVLVGAAIGFFVSGSNLTVKEAFIVVAIQMVVQLLFVPMILGCAENLVESCMKGIVHRKSTKT